MNETIKSILDILHEKKSVRITAHERPDGDALGSSLALRRVLAAQGVEAKVVGLQPVPPRYQFMAQDGEMIAADNAGEWLTGVDAVCVLDCTTLDRAGAFVREAVGTVPIINLDHHEGNPHFGDANWVAPEASCVGEMIYSLARAGGWAISQPAAEAMYVAIITDTGRFAYENTRAEVLRIGAALIDLGVNPSYLEQQVYQAISPKEMRLAGRATETLQLEENGRVGLVTLTRDDFKNLDCTPLDAQDIIDIPRCVAGVEVAIFIYPLPEGAETKVSMRSVAPYDIGAVCRGFGGGGHARAAGCAFTKMSLAKVTETVLVATRDILRKEKAETRG